MIKRMVREHTNMQMEQLILETGLKTSNMVKVSRRGLMGHAMKVVIKMEKKMVTEY
jgi:hypothetical protein